MRARPLLQELRVLRGASGKGGPSQAVEGRKGDMGKVIVLVKKQQRKPATGRRLPAAALRAVSRNSTPLTKQITLLQFELKR